MHLRPSRRSVLVSGAALAALFILTAASRPGSPALETYTSPAVNVFGQPTRVRMLIPVGWVADPPKPVGRVWIGRRSAVTASLTLHPPKRFLLIPPWLRRFISGEPEQGPALVVTFDRGHNDDEEVHMRSARISGHELRIATRDLYVGRGCTIHYLRSDGEQFDSTYRPICDSFQVIR